MKEKVLCVIKGFGIFAGIYLLSQVLVEAILIGVFSLQGYDMLHGELPEGYIVDLFPLYGFAAFALLTILFNRFIRKKKLADMKMRLERKSVVGLLAAMAVGACLSGGIVVFLTLIGAYKFNGVSAVNAEVFIVTFCAYLIQGCSEEILCRGLMQNYFEEKMGRIAAIVLAAVLFTAPHVATIVEYSGVTMILSLANLLLVSVLFSLSMIRWDSLWVPAGIHVGWNFALSYICGLELSGGETKDGVFFFLAESGKEALHGGAYGIEAGIIVTIVLIVCDIILYRLRREK